MKKLFYILFFIFALDKTYAKDVVKFDLFKNYINNLKTMSSNFIQFDEVSGTMSEGVFYIQRPNKVKFEYTHPFKTLLIANGRIVTYYDIDLDEISTIPTKSTPIGVFLNLDLDKIEMLETEIVDENIIFKTKMDIGADVYNVDYTFDSEVKNLLSLHFKTSSDEELTIDLLNIKLNEKLPKDTFIFRNPRLYKRK